MPLAALQLADVTVLVLYLAATVALGLWAGRKNRSAHDFMAAGGRIPGWAVGLSIFGTFVSSISFLALPGKAYAANWNPFVFSLAIPLAAWVAVKWFVPFYRRSGEVSAYAHLEARFGPWARTYAALCFLLVQVARMGTILYLLALALAPLTGWSLPALILITSVIVMVYTLVGGMEAVIWTDVMQSVVLIGGAVLCAVLPMLTIPGGPGRVFEIAAEHHKFSLGSWGASLAEPTVWVVLLYGLVINLNNFGADQNFVQRYATAATDRAANRSVWLGALLYLPISAVFFFIGTALFAYYTAQPQLLPDGLKADAVFPHYIAAALPAGLAGLVIAAVLAAAQSTLSSVINSSATLILCDGYRRHVNPAADDRASLRVLRWASLVVGVLGTLAALAMIQVKSALDVWWKLAGIGSGGVLGLFLLGRISRTGNLAAALATILGMLMITWMTFSPQVGRIPVAWRSPFHEFLISVFGTATVVVAGLLAGHFLGRRTARGRSAADP